MRRLHSTPETVRGRSRGQWGSLLLAVFFSVAACFQATFAAATAQAHHPKKPPLRSASEIDYPPFCFVDEYGRASGFSVELLQATVRAMEREVTFQIGPWNEVKGWLEKGQIQVLPLVGRTPEREAFFDFTFPYMSLHGAIVVREGTANIQTLEDLRGRQVAVMQGDNAEEFLRREDRGIVIQVKPTFVEALRDLSQGHCDAVVIQRLVAVRLIQETGLTNLRIIPKPIEGFRQDFCLAVKFGDRQTLALLNEGLALVMADGTYRRLHAKWFAALQLPPRRLVVGGDHNYPPYEYLDNNGRPAGFNIELTRAIAREMGLELEIRLGPWDTILRSLENGGIDAIQGMFYSPGRSKKFDFSPPYAVKHYVSVVRRGKETPPHTVAELKGSRLVVQRGDAMDDFLVQQGLQDQVNRVETQEDVLREVAAGNYDVGLVVRISAMHLMEKNGWTDLLLGRTPIYSAEYCYAVARDQKALLAQLSEGLKIIEEKGEYRRLREKWLGIYREEPLSLMEALRYSAMVLFPLFLLLLTFSLWSWSLRRQVTSRTAALQRSEAQFRALVEGAPDAIFVQTQYRFAYVNETACRLFGAQSPEQLLGQPVMERFHPSVWDAIFDRIHQINEHLQRVPMVELTYLRLDGRVVPVEVAAVPILYEGKNGALVFVRDISERKQVEHALQQRQGMLTRTEAMAHIGSWEWNLATDTVTWSDELFRIMQRDPAMGPPSFAAHASLYVPEDFARLQQAVSAALEQGTPFDLDLRVQRPDGTVRYTLGVGYPERREDGQVLRMYGFCQDITEIKQAQERITHLNKVLRAIRDVNQLIVRERDRDTLIREGCRLLVDNRGYVCCLIVLIDPDQRPVAWAESGMGETFARLQSSLEAGELPPCCDPGRMPATVTVIQDRNAFCRSCPMGEKSSDTISLGTPLIYGEVCFGYLVAALEEGLTADGEELGLFAEMAADLAYALGVMHVKEARQESEQACRFLEDQLIHAQKMEAVGRLAGGVAHDFNNMLGVIIGHTEIALMRLEPEHHLYLDLEEILKAARRSAEFTRQLLAFARRQTIAPKVLDLNQIVEGMLLMLRRLIGEDIDLVWQPQSGLWPIKMDPAQIDQILANLCVNSRDAIVGVGKITIETGNITVDAPPGADHPDVPAGKYVQLTVRDTGIGIDQKIQDKIFEPFFTTKPMGQGTGLGLATVYGIVKQNNGVINVSSQPGKGATFTIYLPSQEKNRTISLPANPDNLPQSQGETVLLVEDEPAIIKMAQSMLEILGYRVLAAGTPGEALRLAREHPEDIELLLTDVVMPEMHGRDLAETLKTIFPKLKTLYISGYTADVIANRGVLQEGVYFLQKPFALAELAAKIREVLDRPRPVLEKL